MSVTSFFSSIRSWGIERHADAPIAGVAGGLAAAWRVDPLLVRAGFLALTFVGGAGPMIYALCWAFLPDERTKAIHAEETTNGRFPAGLVGAMSLFLITLAVFSSLNFFGALGLIITAVITLLCYGSITGRSSRPASPPHTRWDTESRMWTPMPGAPTEGASEPSVSPAGTTDRSWTTASSTHPGDAPFRAGDSLRADSASAPVTSSFTTEHSSNIDGMGSMSDNTPEPTEGLPATDSLAATHTPTFSTHTAPPRDPGIDRDREQRKSQQRARADYEAQRAKAARERARNERGELRARRRLSGRTGAVLLAIALLAIAAFIIVVDSGRGVFADVSTVAAGIGFTALLFGLIVLGVGIFGRRGGFLSFIALMAALFAIPPMATITTTYSNSTVATSNQWTPRTSADIGTGYSVHMGDASIDFSQFSPDDPPEHVNVASSMASLRMEFDSDQKVAIISDVSMASIDSDSPGALLSNGRSLQDKDIAGFTRDTIFIGGIDSVSEADIIINADISMSSANIYVHR